MSGSELTLPILPIPTDDPWDEASEWLVQHVERYLRSPVTAKPAVLWPVGSLKEVSIHDVPGMIASAQATGSEKDELLLAFAVAHRAVRGLYKCPLCSSAGPHTATGEAGRFVCCKCLLPFSICFSARVCHCLGILEAFFEIRIVEAGRLAA